MPNAVRSGLACSLLLTALSALLGAAPALADGSFPQARQILLRQDRPEQIVLVTNFGLIFSEDGGKTWLFSCEQGLSAYAGPYLLGAAPSNRVFGVAAGAGLIYSDDDSCSWQAAGGAFSGVLPYAFTVDPATAQRVYAIGVPRDDYRNGDSIYVSNDGGLSFGQPVFTSPARSALLSVLVAPSRPSRLFATMFSTPENHPSLLRSDDSGEHWTVAADLVESLGENPFELLAIDPLDEDRLYVRILGASAETLATSDDGGLSFIPSLSIPGKLNAFLKLATGTILVGGTAGKEAVGYRSKDGGQSFEPWPGAPHVHALAERNGKLYVTGDSYADGYAIAESDDEGAHLRPLARFDQVQAIKSCVANLCADSCAYHAGIGLWPEAVCGTAGTSPSGNDADGGAAPDTAASDVAAGAPGGAESGQARRPRISGGGCRCGWVHRPRVEDWTALLILGSMLVGRRVRREPRGTRPVEKV